MLTFICFQNMRCCCSICNAKLLLFLHILRFLVPNDDRTADGYRLAGLLHVGTFVVANKKLDRHGTGPNNDGKWLAMGPVVTA